MFGTIIRDAYTKVETPQIITALDELCSPNDSYGWSSAGIYSFWNYYTKELLYIGLTVDLAERFKQHNGIKKVKKSSCKIEQINNYFEENEKLGYTIFVSSPLAQPVTSKNIYKWFKHDPQYVGVKDFSNEQSKDDLKIIEGILIEAYKKTFGKIPPWNKVGGIVAGQKRTKEGNYVIVESMSALTDSLANLTLLSKYSLRELSDCPTYERYENFMHSIRMLMLSTGVTFEQAIKFIIQSSGDETYVEMIENNYFERILNI
ncbi:GIY-YIG nuclease family protein [Priestia megaterium]|uniref:GIY-YIG nuclease family protein n=1 Tax=Priestia megaterium TaxID=1404 RepID=UPI0025B034D1|nr:GIY-YIG nuclease family protein [Priestia megaterium]MDN3229545.1 GIY-YIG nuclease family protein [Priestia megaterium]